MGRTVKLPEDVAAGDLAYPNLSELVNLVFTIHSVRFGESKFGPYAVVETDHGIYRTSAVVLLKQLQRIAEILKSPDVDGVEVLLVKRKRYYQFIPPEDREA